MTTSGEIVFSRSLWQCGKCRKTHAPVDLAMAVARGEKWTAAVQRKMAYAGATVPFVEASRLLAELAALNVSSSEVDRVVQEHGEILNVLQRKKEDDFNRPQDPLRPGPQPVLSPEKLVIEADASSVLTVGGEEHKSVYCGTVFGLDARGQSGQRPIISERLYAASAEGMDDFSGRLKALAWRGGMRGAQCAFIGDGARCLWKWAENNLPPGTVFIQDFWHVLEHLSDLAQNVFGDDWRKSLERWKKYLRQSKVAKILKELHRLRKNRRGDMRKALDREITYLESGRHRMDYARYEQSGWPIGSGAIEGTCKHLVKSRFNVTGARWRRRNIHKPLALRVAIFNEEWDEYWENRSAA